MIIRVIRIYGKIRKKSGETESMKNNWLVINFNKISGERSKFKLLGIFFIYDVTIWCQFIQ